MAVWGKAVHTNHNPTLYINRVSPHNHLFFAMDACPGHILESTNRIEIRLGL